MLRSMVWLIMGIAFLLMTHAIAAPVTTPLLSSHVDLHDKAALQRGAQLFMNYCAACHSMNYVRYERMAKDIAIVKRNGQVDSTLMRENLIFDSQHKLGDVMSNSLSTEDAKRWFGVAPPDLSVIARVRGKDWLYTYLMSFYRDSTRPWGVNNLVFSQVSMPDVLLTLRGQQIPVYRIEQIEGRKGLQEHKVIDHLQWVSPGTVSVAQFKRSMQDLVAFLVYAGEPAKLQRYKIGIGVLGFLVVLFIFMFLLKREYWKDIK